MSFVIFDTEYTSWKGCQEHGWTGNQKKEIVQIAALKVTDDFHVLKELNLLCKPIINPVLSDYFVALTQITNEQVQKNGVSFEQAYDVFQKFVGDDFCLSHGWDGTYSDQTDGKIIGENLILYRLPRNTKIIFRNIAPVFNALYEKYGIKVKSQSSGQIAKILKISDRLERLGITEHNALYDVYSILEGLKYFKDDINCISPETYLIKL